MWQRLIPWHTFTVLALSWCVLHQGGHAWACALDQVPSMSANGRLAQLNPQVPRTQAELAVWSSFIFAPTYPSGQPIILSEDRSEVARTLMPSAMQQPWGWQFSDGSYGVGWTVQHTYAHAGRYRIRVYAYNPQSRRWDLFDQATIRIAGKPSTQAVRG